MVAETSHNQYGYSRIPDDIADTKLSYPANGDGKTTGVALGSITGIVETDAIAEIKSRRGYPATRDRSWWNRRTLRYQCTQDSFWWNRRTLRYQCCSRYQNRYGYIQQHRDSSWWTATLSPVAVLRDLSYLTIYIYIYTAGLWLSWRRLTVSVRIARAIPYDEDQYDTVI